MNQNIKIINKFLRNNREFAKIHLQGKELVVYLVASNFEYKVSDFSMASEIRQKLEQLEAELGIPVS